MTFLRAVLGITITIGLALLLGRTKDSHPSEFAYSWLGSITALLLLRWFL